MCSDNWSPMYLALHLHSDEVLILQQQYCYDTRQRHSSDINFIPHNEHMSLFLLIHWVTQVIKYIKGCIGLMQLPNTKTETILVAIRDFPIANS